MPSTRRIPRSVLIWYLRLVGLISQLAFAAAIMPESWIVEINAQLGLEPFPEVPIAFYLARHLSLLYGFIGLALILLANRIERYREVVSDFAVAIMLFGLLQGWCDFQSGLPLWWTLGESSTTIAGGLILFWLHRNCDEGTSVAPVG